MQSRYSLRAILPVLVAAFLVTLFVAQALYSAPVSLDAGQVMTVVDDGAGPFLSLEVGPATKYASFYSPLDLRQIRRTSCAGRTPGHDKQLHSSSPLSRLANHKTQTSGQ